MSIIITGSMGIIGKKLMRAFPDAVGLDRVQGADVLCDLDAIQYDSPIIVETLRGSEAVIHLATTSDPDAPAHEHYVSVINAGKIVAASVCAGVKRLILASSDWAQPKKPFLTINTYGYSKRVIEAMADMYSHSQNTKAIALRIGWVPKDASELANAPDWLLENYWDDATLVAAFRKALNEVA